METFRDRITLVFLRAPQKLYKSLVNTRFFKTFTEHIIDLGPTAHHHHYSACTMSVRVLTSLENLEISGNFVTLENSGNLKCTQGFLKILFAVFSSCNLQQTTHSYLQFDTFARLQCTTAGSGPPDFGDWPVTVLLK